MSTATNCDRVEAAAAPAPSASLVAPPDILPKKEDQEGETAPSVSKPEAVQGPDTAGNADAAQEPDPADLEMAQMGQTGREVAQRDSDAAADRYRRYPRTVTWGPVTFNPVVALLGIGVLWGFAIWCIADPGNSHAVLREWKDWIALTFTWLYIGSQDVWIVFLFVVWYKFGHVTLGAKGAAPEFSNVTYFMMIYSCGVAVGLFFYGVSEPLYHLSDNRFAAAGYRTDNEKAQYAINLTLFHWGLHGWVVYCLVAVLVSFCCYIKGLPMTMRSTLHPMIGDQVGPSGSVAMWWQSPAPKGQGPGASTGAPRGRELGSSWAHHLTAWAHHLQARVHHLKARAHHLKAWVHHLKE